MQAYVGVSLTHDSVFKFGVFFFSFHMNTFLNPRHNMCQLIPHHKLYRHFVITEQFLPDNKYAVK